MHDLSDELEKIFLEVLKAFQNRILMFLYVCQGDLKNAEKLIKYIKKPQIDPESMDSLSVICIKICLDFFDNNKSEIRDCPPFFEEDISGEIVKSLHQKINMRYPQIPKEKIKFFLQYLKQKCSLEELGIFYLDIRGVKDQTKVESQLGWKDGYIRNHKNKIKNLVTDFEQSLTK